MLLKPYNDLKSLLSSVTGIKLVDWFNDQYSGTIHAEPAIFVEFPAPLSFETLSKQIQQAPFTVRIHMVSKAIQKNDNSILETVLQSHFNSVESIYLQLQGHRMVENDKLVYNSLSRSALEHHQYMKGWLVTTQDFEGMIYQLEQAKIIHPKPSIEITEA